MGSYIDLPEMLSNSVLKRVIKWSQFGAPSHKPAADMRFRHIYMIPATSKTPLLMSSPIQQGPHAWRLRALVLEPET